MDSSGAYFWQNNSISNGNANQNGIQMNDYMRQQQQQPEQSNLMHEQVQQQVQKPESEEPKTDTPPPNVNDVYGADKLKTDEGGSAQINIVNPDAIEPKARSYTCRICQVTFPNKSAVTVHSRIHTDHQGKPYRCNFCNKGFSTNFYLKQHERIHSGAKPYKCPMCDQSFKQLSHVQQHVRTHTGVRPYKCHWPGCGKAFLQQSHLKSHEARHEPKQTNGQKPYKCHMPECGKTFAQFSNLKSHLARHTSKNKSKSKSQASQSASNSVQRQEQPMPSTSFQMSTSDVINQAAAAADIVPSFCAEEEAEIRPFLCPGCSKLYVREATFKKHLEECKTKLQQSISATASALGITPPPMPATIATSPGVEVVDSAAASNDDFNTSSDGALVICNSSPQPSSSSSSSSTVRCKKRRMMHTKSDEDDQPSNNLHNHQQHENVNMAPQISLQSLMSSTGIIPVSHIKQEDGNEQLPTVVTASQYDIGMPYKQQQHNTVGMVNSSDEGGMYQQNVATTSNDVVYRHEDLNDQHQQQMTTANSQQLLGQHSTIAPTHHRLVTSEQNTIMSQSSVHGSSINEQQKDLEASTINQAAIRWRWEDQSLPRLNFP